MKQTFGIVIIGVGYMGCCHLEGIHNNPRISIIAVIDHNIDKAQQVSQQYNIAEFSDDWHKYVTDKRVNAVIICTYPNTHFNIAKAFLDENKAVLCEKPMEDNMSMSTEFFEYGMHCNAKLMFGHILRHNLTYQTAYNMIRDGFIGSPIVMRLSQLKPIAESEVDTYKNLLNNSSPIIDCGVHYLDVMRWFTNSDAVSFCGIGQCLDADIAENTYNYGMLNIRFSDGSVGFYEAGWSRSFSYESTKEFAGPLGKIKIVYRNQRPLEEQQKGNQIIYTKNDGSTFVQDVLYDEKPVNAQLNAFLDMIENDVDHRPFLKDVYRAMQEAVLGHRAICENRTFYTLDRFQQIQWNPMDAL